MLARWMTLLVWSLAGAAAVAWGLKVLVQPTPVPPGAQRADAAPVLQADLTRLLGADPPPPPPTATEEPAADARFALLGVVAPRGTAGRREGVALIAVDGQTPRAYRVGARIDGETVLQAVNARGAELGPRGGPARVALALAPPTAATTGVLPGLHPGAAPLARPGAGSTVRVPAPVPPFARPGVFRPAGPNMVSPQAPQAVQDSSEPDPHASPGELPANPTPQGPQPQRNPNLM